jgi:hypothetical protein
VSKNWEMTFGCELELADVDRRIVLPEELGDWDYCECDIVNTLPPYRGVAADPLGEVPQVGGEIHVRPGKTPKELALRVQELLDFLERKGSLYSASPASPFHVHIRTKGLRDDIGALKRLAAFVRHNQHYIFDKVWGYVKDPRMSPFVARYLRTDGALPMPNWMADNILAFAVNFDDFIRLHCCGKDAKSRGRPFRYGINLYCLKHIDTIEFRFFHATVSSWEILNCVVFCEDLLKKVLLADDDKTAGIAKETYESRHWPFPPFVYDHELMAGWERTKYGKDRCRPKVRKLHDI